MSQSKRVSNRYNHGISELEAAYQALQANNINLLQEKLHNCGMAIYESYEWALNDAIESLKGRIKSIHRFASDYRTLVNRNDKSFYANVAPVLTRHFNLADKGVDLGSINSNKSKVRNIAVHQGAIPDHETLMASLEGIAKFISTFYADIALTAIPKVEDLVVPVVESIDPAWDKFITACDSFSNERTYILVIDRVDANATDLSLLSKLNWTLIIDLDPDTESNGFFTHVSADLAKRRKVHLFTPEQNLTFAPYSSLYWLAARGMSGRPSTITQDIKDWRRKSKQLINNRVLDFSRSIEPPVTAIFLTESQYAKDLCECIDNAFGANNEFLYCVSDPMALSRAVEEYDGTQIKIDFQQIISGLRRFTNVLDISEDQKDPEILLPGKEDTDVVLPIEEFRSVEEYLTVVHKNIHSFEHKPQERIDFLKGNEITWYGLHRRFDVDRDITAKLIKKVEFELSKRENATVFLDYAPGFGGTTVIKRVAWNFHDSYPTLLVLKYEPRLTATNIHKIYMATNKPVLVVVENSQINNDSIGRLVQEVKALTFPSTFLITQRHSTKIRISQDRRSPYEIPMPPALSDKECGLFVETYKEFAPHRKNELDKILSSPKAIEKHPFYIGLIAFLEDFQDNVKYFSLF